MRCSSSSATLAEDYPSPMPETWVLTGSLDNFRATREHGFRVIGAKERRRRLAERIEPGDLVVFYVTGVQAFGGIVRVTGGVFEDPAPPWPRKPPQGGGHPGGLPTPAGGKRQRGWVL